MADIGTSVALQGRYKPDYMDAIRATPESKGGIGEFVDNEERKAKEREKQTMDALKPYMSIDASKYLPNKVSEVDDMAKGIVAKGLELKRQKGANYNISLDPDMQKAISDFNAKSALYQQEKGIVSSLYKEIINDNYAKDEYDPETIEMVSKMMAGEDDVSTSKIFTMNDAKRTYHAFGTPKAKREYLESMFPTSETIEVTNMLPDGTKEIIKTSGLQLAQTPEGRDIMYQTALSEFDKQTPYAKRYAYEIEQELNKRSESDLMLKSMIGSMTLEETAEIIRQRAAQQMVDDAINNLKSLDSQRIVGGGSGGRRGGGSGDKNQAVVNRIVDVLPEDVLKNNELIENIEQAKEWVNQGIVIKRNESTGKWEQVTEGNFNKPKKINYPEQSKAHILSSLNKQAESVAQQGAVSEQYQLNYEGKERGITKQMKHKGNIIEFSPQRAYEKNGKWYMFGKSTKQEETTAKGGTTKTETIKKDEVIELTPENFNKLLELEGFKDEWNLRGLPNLSKPQPQKAGEKKAETPEERKERLRKQYLTGK
jgi:hypothetical protein